LGFQDLSPEKIPVKPRALSPVRKVDIHQVELPSLDGIETPANLHSDANKRYPCLIDQTSRANSG
jgi:hypothetical protein